MNAWPFSLAELTAGLRRYFAEPGLRVRTLEALPERQGGRSLRVTYSLGGRAEAGEPLGIECVLKEPDRTGRAGLAHPGVREAGVYRSLAGQIPMATPVLIAADPDGHWLVLEAVDARPVPQPWATAGYRQAITALEALHERFWGLSDDLAAYPWLARPLTLDYEIHVYAAAQALGHIVHEQQPASLAHSAEALSGLGQVISQADGVVRPLRALPFTLIHGNFWEGSLLQDEDGELVVLDWGLAGIGPGVLDLVTMVTRSRFERDCPAPLAEGLVEDYRRAIGRGLGVEWTDAEWAGLWDHALLWRFLQEMLPWAASAAPEAFAERAECFETVWLQPVLAAASRRLAPLLTP